VAALVALAATIGAAAVGWRAAREADAAEKGRALYAGERPLPGRILGHETDLPAEASRCSNCHGQPGSRNEPGQTYAPPLGKAMLTTPRPRRGGPPSVYTAEALCTLLRSGVDPAHVVIPRTMPRYRPSDEDCAALWAHMIS